MTASSVIAVANTVTQARCAAVKVAVVLFMAASLQAKSTFSLVKAPQSFRPLTSCGYFVPEITQRLF